MQIRDYINTKAEYNAVKQEILHYVESTWIGLSVEFNSIIEVVCVSDKIKYSKAKVRGVVNSVNWKIEQLLSERAERIYIAERLDRIYARHPTFDIDVSSIEDIKANPLFLQYLDELIIRPGEAS